MLVQWEYLLVEYFLTVTPAANPYYASISLGLFVRADTLTHRGRRREERENDREKEKEVPLL